MQTRRTFIKGAMIGTAGIAASRSSAASSDAIRAVMLHMGMNMWGDWHAPDEPVAPGRRYAKDEIFFNESIWRKTVAHAKKKNLNMVVMDLGEFLEYPSHPELAVKGSWKADRMAAEVKRLRTMGLEPIPSLNFSATHDCWLQEYHRMLSTRIYYGVCADILKDVAEIFGTPRLIHIGFDEECYKLQSGRGVIMIRQHEMWWHDLYWFVNTVEKLGMRAIVSADYGWKHPEYVKKCPKSVVQQNWYYNQDAQGYVIEKMAPEFKPQLQLYIDLEKAGFDQFPCVTNWISERAKKAGLKNNADNAREMVKFCRRHIAPERLLGFMMASWADTQGEATCRFNCAGIDQLDAAMRL